MAVYYDTVYGSFLFVPIDRPRRVSGCLTTPSGAPIAHEPITLTAGGVTYRTVTGRSGTYRFFDLPDGRAELHARGVSRALHAGAMTPDSN
jgi:hypothetical protein